MGICLYTCNVGCNTHACVYTFMNWDLISTFSSIIIFQNEKKKYYQTFIHETTLKDW